MKKTLFILAFLFSTKLFLIAQITSDAAVQITASVQVSPPQIILSWIGNTSSNSYQVFRKLKSSTAWGNAIASLGGTTNQYTDNTVSPNVSYEYRVVRNGTGYAGYGYINSGINLQEIFYRGKIILLVDSTFSNALSSEISRWISDVQGDGWDVIRHDVLRTASVPHVKSLIVKDYVADSVLHQLKAIFIFGHVPVPYSGNINPDGHPDHLGAWPADCFYGDADGVWTDITVNSTTVSPARTQNIPGDGKYDQSSIPGDVELQVGRVDFSNMPAFAQSEQQLLKNYLDKDHNYRKKIFTAIKQGVIDDNFGYFSGEAFAASGYKNLSVLVGNSNIQAADYITSMSATSYLWSYGCGGGSYTSASGIGSTTSFTNTNLQGVFSMLFGSYFGDWDSQNNFLRAPLAQGNILTNVWSGRPHYQFHHMAMGENIGYGILMTQNNPGGLYFASPTGITGKWVHNALMGDPTLRNDVVAPVSNVIATRVNSDCNISWTASTETNIAGYNIYMRNDTNNFFVKINSAPVATTTYTDHCLLYKGVYTYMVRTLKLENTPSGTYYNMSEGIADTAWNSNNIASIASFTSSVSGNVASFFHTNNFPSSYSWDFGNGSTSTAPNPTVAYNANGVYIVQLIAANNCYADTSYQSIGINEVGLTKNILERALEIFPNPTTGKIILKCNTPESLALTVYNAEGKKVFYKEKTITGAETDLSFLPAGIYFLQAQNAQHVFAQKIIIEK